MAVGSKLQIRIDEQVKKEAEAVFAEVGVDATTAVRMFYKKVAQTRSIPFRLSITEPEFTPEQVERILDAARQAKDPENLYGPFDTAEELIASLHASASGSAALRGKKKPQLEALTQARKSRKKTARR